MSEQTFCKACGHADDHSTAVLEIRDGQKLGLCNECLANRRICSGGMRDFASLAHSRAATINVLRVRVNRRTERIADLNLRLITLRRELTEKQQQLERVEIEAAEWAERARVAEGRVDEFVKNARREWWKRTFGQRYGLGVDPARSGSDRTVTTVTMLREEYERMQSEIAVANSRVTELQTAATQRVFEWRKERAELKAEIDRLKRSEVLVWVNGRLITENTMIEFDTKPRPA